MKVLTIVGVNLRRMARERSNLFFVVLFPVVLILVLGLAFGGAFVPRIGVAGVGDGRFSAALADALAAQEDLEITRYESREALATDVERGLIEAGVIIPADYDALIAGGAAANVEYLAAPDSFGFQLRSVVDAAVAEQSRLVRAARFLAAEQGIDFAEGLARTETVAAALPAISVAVTTAGERTFPEDLGRFDVSASSQLLLFMFLTSLVASSALIQTRRLGVARRMIATPTSAGQVLLGETLGRFGVALVQGIIIVVATLVLFDVDWGNPLGATALVIAFAAVGSGAGMLMGAVFRNDEQAGSAGVLIGLVLAALGGCMFPLELFPEGMQRVAHLTPHAWALDGFAELVRRDGTVLDILLELGVLAAFAGALLLLATWRLRKVLTS